jgi:hypothetical protein
MNQIRNISFALTIVFLSGCSEKSDVSRRVQVAKVFDTYLYLDDLTGLIPAGLSPGDSTAAAKDYIEKWVRNQLILNKAELNLTEQEKDVDQLIENYRTSLLVYTYEQSYVREKLDTSVTPEEIKSYLDENSSNFILGEPVIKGMYIKVPANAPEIWKLRQWCASGIKDNAASIETYCYQNAEKYDYFNQGWINLSEAIKLFPENYSVQESSLRYRHYLEAQDSSVYYFLVVSEYALGGDISPLDLVENDIKTIIINKRKINLLTELEASIYEDGLNRNYFTIY